MKVQQTIVAKCPNLSVPHRRLVCYCRLYEVPDRLKKERPGLHQREVFLFNDLLVITKIHSRKKNSVTYTFRQSYLLAGMVVTLFETSFYPYGIQLAQKWDRKIILTLNARNEHDRSKFVEDLKESIAEMDEMEALRLESELEKQRLSMADNRDSGINETESSATCTSSDILMRSSSGVTGSTSNGTGSAVVMRKSAINNSLLDLTDASEKLARRGSVGSLDSGMSISFQSNSIFNNHQCSQNNYHHRSPRVNGASCSSGTRQNSNL
jgi:IQ motif/SEC7 domain-containing protein